MTIAVDFDGTLTMENLWPHIGTARKSLISWLIEARKSGHKVILWTCRDEQNLKNAIEWCSYYGLEFDAVNDNTEEHKGEYGGNPRKIFADVYIDDKALDPYTFYRLQELSGIYENK